MGTHWRRSKVVFGLLAAVAALAVCVPVALFATYALVCAWGLHGCHGMIVAFAVYFYSAVAAAVLSPLAAVVVFRRLDGFCWKGFAATVGILSLVTAVFSRLFWPSHDEAKFFVWIVGPLLFLAIWGTMLAARAFYRRFGKPELDEQA